MFKLHPTSYGVVVGVIATLFLSSGLAGIFLPLDTQRQANMKDVWAFSSGAAAAIAIGKKSRKEIDEEDSEDGDDKGNGTTTNIAG